MTTFRPGTYTTFLQIGKNTFQDTIKFIKKDNGMNIERIRRRADSFLFKKFVKYERNFLTFNYLDVEHPLLGGKLVNNTNEINFSQFRSHTFGQVGYFTDDRIVFAQFGSGDISLEDGPKLDQIINPAISSTDIIVRHNYEVVGDVLQYRLEVNPNLAERYHEEIQGGQEISSELVPKLPLTYTERFFIQLGKN